RSPGPPRPRPRPRPVSVGVGFDHGHDAGRVHQARDRGEVAGDRVQVNLGPDAPHLFAEGILHERIWMGPGTGPLCTANRARGTASATSRASIPAVPVSSATRSPASPCRYA